MLVLVDQARYRMQVRVGGRVTRELEIGLGQESGQKRREGDLRTPKGIYFVVDKQKGPFGGRVGRLLRRLLDQGELPGAGRRGLGPWRTTSSTRPPRRRSWRPGANAS